MSGGEEYADAARSLGAYPTSWGRPAGEQFSETRIAWVRSKLIERVVERGEADVIAARNADVIAAYRRLSRADGRLLSILRAAEINRRKYGPVG
jgi:hypothetical protein